MATEFTTTPFFNGHKDPFSLYPSVWRHQSSIFVLEVSQIGNTDTTVGFSAY